MIYLYWTYVDAQTGIPCLAALMRHGPANPAVPGLQFGFALESRYPTPHPVFYGTCPADTPPEALALPGVLADAEVVAWAGKEIMTYRANKASDKTDWKALAERLLPTVSEALRAQFLAEFTTTVPGQRVLRLGKALEA